MGSEPRELIVNSIVAEAESELRIVGLLGAPGGPLDIQCTCVTVMEAHSTACTQWRQQIIPFNLHSKCTHLHALFTRIWDSLLQISYQDTFQDVHLHLLLSMHRDMLNSYMHVYTFTCPHAYMANTQWMVQTPTCRIYTCRCNKN